MNTRAPVTIDRLADPTRRLHRALLTGLLRTGAVPDTAELAQATGIEPPHLMQRLQELVTGDYAAVDATGQLTCLYPLSVVSTNHVLVLNGQRRYAMCAIDALGIPAMLGHELEIESSCPICHVPLRLHVGPGAIVTAQPSSIVVVARHDEQLPAAGVCCPFTVFVCTTAHGHRLREQVSGTALLSLDEAVEHGEALFADLLRAESLPVNRRRWGCLGTADR